MTTKDLLNLMQVAENTPIYVLRTLERRITVYSQQVRALNLVYALHTEGEIKPGYSVGNAT
jgi:hypothetical protein